MDPQSIIHRCLLAPENISRVCDELPRGDLANLARVCRSVSNRALERLWHTIDDAVDVFRGSFECDFFKLGPSVTCYGALVTEWQIVRELTEDDMQPIRRRASRVRVMRAHLQSDGMNDLSIDALYSLRLAVERSQEPLFPNLHTLEIHYDTPEYGPLFPEATETLSVLFGPDIRDFKMHGMFPEGVLLLRKLVEVAGLVSKISFLTEEFEPFPVSVIPRLTMLESITLDHLSFDGLGLLSQFPRLRSLSYLAAPDEVRGKLSAEGCREMGGCFRRLEELTIRSTLEEALLIVRELRRAPLKTVAITDTRKRPLSKITTLIHAILSASQHNTLRSMEILIDSIPVFWNSTTLESAASRRKFVAALEKLCGYSNLERVYIKPAITPEVPFYVIEDLATTLPNLTELNLVHGPLEKYPPTLRFYGYTADQLVALLQMLPNLRKLGLHFDFSQYGLPPMIPQGGRGGFSHAKLEQLDVGWSLPPSFAETIVAVNGVEPVVDGRRLVTFLSGLCPNLKAILIGNNYAHPSLTAWATLVDEIKRRRQ